jgi:formylglycine-generating enzyme required for sulfatase activity
MGDRLLTGFGAFDSDVRRVVSLSPFHVDLHEVTVSRYRASGGPAGDRDIVPWSGSLEGTAFEDWCMFTRTPGAHEDHPVNCLVHKAARAFCVAQGGDLPTEAQLEYLIGGLANFRYPWGVDEPSCGDAVFGLGGWPGFASTQAFANLCRKEQGPREDVIGYPHAVTDSSVRRLDSLDIRGAKVIDLGANLSEWTRDHFAPQTSPCWDPPILHDPVCETGQERVIRGGSWLLMQVAAGRGAILPNEANLTVGFRCVYPGE